MIRLVFILLGNLFFLNHALAERKKSAIKKPSIFSCICALRACFTDNFHTVQKNKLYRSKQLSTKKYRYYIKKYKIRTIINLRGHHPHKKWWQREAKLSQQLAISHYDIPMSALTFTSKENLLTLLRLYEEAPKPILIHCQGGADRTGEAAALWKIDQEKVDKKKAIDQLNYKFGHLSSKYPKKQILIRAWKGRYWLEREYEPELLSEKKSSKYDIKK